MNLTDEQKVVIKYCNNQFLKNEEIMAKWKIKYPNVHLMYDGIMDYYKFYEKGINKKRILFLLREENNEQQWIDKKSFELGHCPNLCYLLKQREITNKTYKPLAELADVIFTDGNKNDIGSNYFDLLDNIAIMNLSKVPGMSDVGKTKKQYQTIAFDNIDLLKLQYENIKPDYIFICMTDKNDYDIVNKFTNCYSINCKEYAFKINGKEIKIYVRKNESQTFFFFPHPSNRGGLNSIYREALIEYIKEVKNK